MPTYTYETISTDPDQEPSRFEIFQKISEDTLTHHPETGEPVRKIIASGFSMKRRIVNGGTNIDKSSAAATACGCATGKAHSHANHHNPFKREQNNGISSQTHSFGHTHQDHK